MKATAAQPGNALAYAGGTCANFTFTAYSLAQDGTATPAGEPVSFITTASPSGTVAIAGCIDSATVTGNDWEYMVTATTFLPCSGPLPLGVFISPTAVYTVVKLDCQKGLDIAATATVDVSVTTKNNAGYTDIGAIVHETEVDVGCKTPDNTNNPGNNTNIYKFGDSWIGDITGSNPPAPNGLWGYTAADGGFQQWSGQTGVDPAATDQYYTGTLDTSSITDTTPQTMLQTFVPDCSSSTLGTSYSGTSIPACVGSLARSATAFSFLADPTLLQAFERNSAGWAAANINTTTNVIKFVTSPTSNVIQAGSTPNAHVADLANNLMTVTPFPFDLGTLQAISPYHGVAGLGFVVTYSAPNAAGLGVPSWATIEYGTTTGWTITHSGTIAGTTAALLDCLGLFSTFDGCYKPATCFPPPAPVVVSFILRETTMAALAAAGSVTVNITDSAGAATVQFTNPAFVVMNSGNKFVGASVVATSNSFTVTLPNPDAAVVENGIVMGLEVASAAAVTAAAGAIHGTLTGPLASALTLEILGGVIP